ncbi:MAG: GDP-mannose 4,6-dehydratase [Alcaligenaceae bacterium]|nr:MAG: GDP-mannose 4,6-dehydratase [Alcaligenaceae bacterium]
MSGPVPRALITGISGQDGGFLAEQLSGLGWEVSGIVTPHSPVPSWVKALPAVHLDATDISDADAVHGIVSKRAPNYIFHLAGISSVFQSWQDPLLVSRVNSLGSVCVFEAAYKLQQSSGSEVRVVNASSAEIFGGTHDSPQSESSLVAPISPYGVTKAFSHSMAHAYRERGLFVSNAILYNHESPRRPLSFVTRKITRAAAEIASGVRESVKLGDLTARRDWGWAPEYVDAMLKIAVTRVADDFVLGTGESHSVMDFVRHAFKAAGIDDWSRYVEFDSSLKRRAESIELVADARKAAEVLSWKPSVGFDSVVKAMVEFDLNDVNRRLQGE